MNDTNLQLMNMRYICPHDRYDGEVDELGDDLNWIMNLKKGVSNNRLMNKNVKHYDDYNNNENGNHTENDIKVTEI